MGERVWNVNEMKTKWNAHVLILPAPEGVCAVNAWPITEKITNYRGVFSRPVQKEATTAQLKTLLKL